MSHDIFTSTATTTRKEDVQQAEQKKYAGIANIGFWGEVLPLLELSNSFYTTIHDREAKHITAKEFRAKLEGAEGKWSTPHYREWLWDVCNSADTEEEPIFFF